MQVNQEDRIAPQEKSSGNSGIVIILLVLVLLIAGGAYYYFSGEQEPQQTAEPTQVELPEPAPSEPLPTQVQVPEPETMPEPETEVVQPEVEPEQPLPSLSESDEYVHEKAVAMADGMKIEPLLVEQDLVRQFVVFVDNLAQGELARKTSPMKGPSDTFTVSEIANKTYLDPDSYHRYDLYADFLTGLNDEQLLNTYRQLSPLLEQAFDELGYPNLKFDERMQQAIKVLLATPVIEDPIELYAISVNYKFVDPKLEALPNAQKMLVRMGPENTRKIKTVLRRLQSQLNN